MQENDKILIEKLEELNREYLDEGHNELGKYIRYIMKLLKKGRIIKVFRLFLMHLKSKRHKNKKETSNVKIKDTKYEVDTGKNCKIAIYTCITGNYDNVEEPLITEKCCDYFLYTNNEKIKSDNWKIKEIPSEISQINNNAKINRYIKMHPHELFKDYDYAIYIDGNIKLISVISSYVEKINNKTGLAIHKHSANNCVFDEIKTCRAYGKGDYSKLKKQAQRYKKEGFPKDYGMLECNVLVSDMKNKNAEKIFDGWWEEYLLSESMRDQIALPYVLWRLKIPTEEIGNLGKNVNKNPSLKINSHM